MTDTPIYDELAAEAGDPLDLAEQISDRITDLLPSDQGAAP